MIWTSTKKSILNSYKYHLGKGGVDWGNLILHTIHKAVSNAQYPTHTWPTSKFTENSEIWIYYTFTLHLAEAPEPREPQEPKTMNKNMNISYTSENLKYEYLLLKHIWKKHRNPGSPGSPGSPKPWIVTLPRGATFSRSTLTEERTVRMSTAQGGRPR